MVEDVDARELHLVIDRIARFFPGRHLRGRYLLSARPARDISEVALGQLDPPLGLEVTDQHQYRVVRRVVGPEEPPHILQARRVEVLHETDRRVAIRVALREGQPQHRLHGQPIGPVLIRLPALVLHDVTLVVQLLLGDRRLEIAHPIRFQPEPKLELVGRQRLEVVRPIEPGAAVQRAAGILHVPEVRVVRDMFGALEHQVLEQVREAGTPGTLVLGADVIHHVDRDHRRRVVLLHDHAQPVVERLLRKRKLDDSRTHPDTPTTPIRTSSIQHPTSRFEV